VTAILASILLLLELNSPFDGAIRISSTPMDCWPAMCAHAMRTSPLAPAVFAHCPLGSGYLS
jgi:hypothetical protein